jgi:PleD family two-component response regulator
VYVAAMLDDVFFASKLREAAKSAGVHIDFIKQPEGIIEKLCADAPSVVIIDLDSRKIDTIELIKEIKNTETLREVLAVGYLPHVEKDLKKKALDAGCDTVLPRSRFSAEMREMFSDFSRAGDRAGKAGQ